MEVQQVLCMNGGNDETSYAKNSAHERLILWKVKALLESCIEELFRSTAAAPDYQCTKIADLGCSSGPNTFESVLGIIESMDKIITCRRKTTMMMMNQDDPPPPPMMVQVFLNDLFGNDFNTVFGSLPGFYRKLEELHGRHRSSCLVAAMPGSFYGRLFPNSSMHFLHSSYSLHWLSQVPNGLVTELGKPLNEESIYIGETSPPVVLQAYQDQFTKDFTMFLKNRYEELVSHGQLFLTIVSKNDDEIDGPHVMNILGDVLNDMVLEGFVKREKLGLFNIPQYAASMEEVRSIIMEEGSFKIRHLETFKLPLDASLPRHDDDHDHDHDHNVRAAYVATFIRAVFEPILQTHFGSAAINMTEVFQRFATKTARLLEVGKGVVNTMVISLAKE